jgi:thiol-disulfide isomerase/thioredoxin
MKKTLILSIVIIVIGLTAFLFTGIATKTHLNKIAKERITVLPVFSMKTLNDTIFRSDLIKSGPVIILHFHPECEHCKYEISTLFKCKAELSGTQVILISNAEKEVISNFLKENNLLNYPGSVALLDETYSFKSYFGTGIVPATFIYDKKLKLVKFFQGEVRPETILKYLRQE